MGGICDYSLRKDKLIVIALVIVGLVAMGCAGATVTPESKATLSPQEETVSSKPAVPEPEATPMLQTYPETEEEVAAELIRALKLYDWEYANSPLAIDWSEPVEVDVMVRVIKWWYEDKEVHPYLEFECEDKRLGGAGTPLVLTYSCYGTQDTLGDEIVTFSQVRHIPSDKTISMQHEFAHQTDFQSPARYVLSTVTIGESTKTSTYEDVRQQGGFDKVEASREEWKSLR